jgi:hypothetical protein
MGNKLIIKDKFAQLRKGYPTVSDKYNVAGGILDADSSSVAFGDLVQYGTTVGYYTSAAGASSAANIAGIVLATNVKLTGTWPDTTDGSLAHAKEAFNLLLDGHVAVQLDSAATANQIAPGKKLAVILATGKLTTFDKVGAGVVEMPGYYFTGIYEDNLAEIEVRR